MQVVEGAHQHDGQECQKREAHVGQAHEERHVEAVESKSPFVEQVERDVQPQVQGDGKATENETFPAFCCIIYWMQHTLGVCSLEHLSRGHGK